MTNREIIFLTVGNNEQKLICKKIIAENKDFFDIPVIVVSDDDYGCRIGSGGAALNLIAKFYKPGCKMAIINSGGKSKRSINYAVKGKVFANIEINGRAMTLFELLYDNSRKLMSRFDSGVLICCSDILFNTDSFSDAFSESTAFCVNGDIDTATRHGVMFCDSEKTLIEYPHKSTPEKLIQIQKGYNTDSFPIDTGTVFFKEELCLSLYNAVTGYDILTRLAQSKTEINLYSDILAVFAEKCKKNDYLDSDNSGPVHRHIKEVLFEAISNYKLKVEIIEDQSFLHFGSLNEALTNILELAGKKDSYVSINSHIVESDIGKNTVLDNVILKKGCHIGNNCLLSDVSLDEGTRIEDNMLVCGIKLKDESYVTVLCDISENPKKVVDSKELWETERFYKGTSFNDSLDKLLARSEETAYSIDYCIKNADTEYLYTRSQYIKELTAFNVNDNYLKIRKEILENHFRNTPTLPCAGFISEKTVVELPLRINMSGTWTDAMPYCIDNGGQVINMAITVNGERPVTVILEKIPENRIEFCSDGATSVFDFKNTGAIETDLSDFNLHIAVLKTIGITRETVLPHGFRLTTEVRGIDKGSGLGVSSILLGGCIKAFIKALDLQYDDSEILTMVFVAEQIMGTGGGWQDQVGGLLPAVKAGTTFPGIRQELHIEYIDIAEKFKSIFSERSVIIPTGQRHFGRFIVNDVADRYLSRNKDSLFGHKEIRALNDRLTDSLRQGDYPEFCRCINRHFELLKYISPLVSNPKIDNLISDCLENISDAASVCGAGGGGYVFAVLKEGVTVNQAQDFINKNHPYINSQIKQIQLLTEI